MLGRSNIGRESYLMMDNADATFITGKELDEDNNEWLAINLLKLRYAPEVLKYIVHIQCKVLKY